jgi:putative ABC transport system permease protein
MWFKQLLTRRKLYDDLSEEIRQHLAEKTEALMAHGMTREEAGRTARRDFGNLTGIEERGREPWAYPFLEGVWRDFLYAVRQLRKNPGYALTAILTLALGIGATAAVFSLVNAVLLRPLPFPESDRLMWLSQQDHSLPGAATESLSYPDYFDWRAQNHTLSGLASYLGSGVTLRTGAGARRLDTQIVSSNFFDVLGVAPIAGRDFGWADEKPGNRAVMLSYELWESEFGSARSVIGSSIDIDDHSYTVAGVMPKGFRFPLGNPAPALWKSLAEDLEGKDPRAAQRGFDVLGVIGRLRPGVTPEQARADLSVIAADLARQYPDSNKQYYSALVKPQIEFLTGDVRPAMRLLFGAVALILLLVCANVAGLILARGYSRGAEFAVRAAIGAGKAIIIRQVLVESVTLFVCGGAAGVALAAGSLRAATRFIPVEIPRAEMANLDARVLLFVLMVSLVTGVLFGTFPALRVSLSAPHGGLREGSRTVSGAARRHRLHSGLVIAQTAIGVVLLIGSGLLMRSLIRIMHVDPGFDPTHVATSRIAVSFDLLKHDQHFLFYQRLLPRISALPGVTSASAGWPLPMSNSSATISFNIVGRPVAKGDEPSENLGLAMPGYFETMRIPLIAGRSFSERDGLAGPPTAVINRAFAAKYFPNQNPVGQRMQARLGDGVFNDPIREIVGVVGNIKRKGLTADAEPQYYLPYAQAVIANPFLVVRTSLDPASVQHEISAAIHEFDKNAPVYQVSTMEQYLSKSTAQPKFQAFLLASFAGAGLVLSAIGLYGLLSYIVVQRTSEIGLRMALGAQRSDVLGMIVRRGLLLSLMGAAAGLAVSAVITRFLSELLFHVQPTDPLTFAITAGLLLLTGLAASGLPAYRAARLDPIRTLREQ